MECPRLDVNADRSSQIDSDRLGWIEKQIDSDRLGVLGWTLTGAAMYSQQGGAERLGMGGSESLG